MVREATAAGILRYGKEDRTMNLADILTKFLSIQNRLDLYYYIMW